MHRERWQSVHHERWQSVRREPSTCLPSEQELWGGIACGGCKFGRATYIYAHICVISNENRKLEKTHSSEIAFKNGSGSATGNEASTSSPERSSS